MENSAAILFKLYPDMSIIDQIQTLPIIKVKISVNKCIQYYTIVFGRSTIHIEHLRDSLPDHKEMMAQLQHSQLTEFRKQYISGKNIPTRRTLTELTGGGGGDSQISTIKKTKKQYFRIRPDFFKT